MQHLRPNLSIAGDGDGPALQSAMPHLIVRPEVATHLRQLVSEEHAGPSQGSPSATSLARLRRELDDPPRPDDPDAHYEPGVVLSHRCLVDVACSEGIHNGYVQSLQWMLRGARIAIARKPPPERSPELVERLRQIQLAREQEEYDQMMPSSFSTSTPSYSFLDSLRGQPRSGPPGQHPSREEQEWREVRQQVSAIINVLVSVAAVAIAVWWAGGTASPAWKTLVAMPLCFLIAIAETVLYARHFDNIRKKRQAGGKSR